MLSLSKTRCRLVVSTGSTTAVAIGGKAGQPSFEFWVKFAEGVTEPLRVWWFRQAQPPLWPLAAKLGSRALNSG
jgi:hypothetical protein